MRAAHIFAFVVAACSGAPSPAPPRQPPRWFPSEEPIEIPDETDRTEPAPPIEAPRPADRIARAQRVEALRAEAIRSGGRADSFQVVDDPDTGVSILTYDRSSSPDAQVLGWLVTDEGAVDISEHLMEEIPGDGDGFAGYRARRLHVADDPHVGIARVNHDSLTVLAIRASDAGLTLAPVQCNGSARIAQSPCGNAVRCTPRGLHPAPLTPSGTSTGRRVLPRVAPLRVLPRVAGWTDAAQQAGLAEAIVAVESPDRAIASQTECTRALDRIVAALYETSERAHAAVRALLPSASAAAPACSPPDSAKRARALPLLRAAFLRRLTWQLAHSADDPSVRRDLGREALDEFDRNSGGLDWSCLDPSSGGVLVEGGVEVLDPPLQVLWRVHDGRVVELYRFDFDHFVDVESSVDLTGDGVPETLYHFHQHEGRGCSWEVVSPSWERPIVLVPQCPDYFPSSEDPYVKPVVTAAGTALLVGRELKLWDGRAFSTATTGFEEIRAALEAERRARERVERATAALPDVPVGWPGSAELCENGHRAAWASGVARSLRDAGIEAAQAVELAAAPVGLTGCGPATSWGRAASDLAR